MNNAWSWLVVVGFAVAWLGFTRLGKISNAKAHELVASGAILIDVRTVGEFAQGHLPGARNVPLQELSNEAPALMSEHQPIVVYCASGMRSAVARRILRAAGGEQVHDLGAMSRW
jgi:rhodanese-related sulfurtransferase